VIRSGCVSGLQALGDVLETQTFIGEQHDEVVDEVGGFIEYFLLTASYCREGQFHAFFTDLLCDSLVAGGRKPDRVALVASLRQPVLDNTFEFGNEINVRFAHGWSSDSYINVAVRQITFQVWYRYLGTVEHARGECAINVCILENTSKVLHRSCAT